MLNHVFELYKNNVKYFLVLALIKVIILFGIAKLFFPQTLITQTINVIISNGNFRDMNTNNLGMMILMLIVIFLVFMLYESVILFLDKRIIYNETFNLKEIFKDAFYKYKEIIGVSFLVSLIEVGLALCLVVAVLFGVIGLVLGIIIIIYAIYFGTTVRPITSYMVIMNDGITDSFREGRAIGKNKFWVIFLLTIINGLVTLLLNISCWNGSLILSLISVYVIFLVESFIFLYIISMVNDYLKSEEITPPEKISDDQYIN